MFALGVELLTGRYAATAYNDRAAVEWPPHPARLFSALVSTWADGDPFSGEGEAELQALRWLERQPAPEILASASANVARRSVVPVFVPVNDTSVVSMPATAKRDAAVAALSAAADVSSRDKASRELVKQEKKILDEMAKAIAAPTKSAKSDAASGAAVLPWQRTKQPRTFPTAIPEEGSFSFVWADSDLPEPLATAMARLVERVIRIGHSSSQVAIRLLESSSVASLRERVVSFVPDDAHGRLVVRWVGNGQVDLLNRAFALHRETEPRVLPARFVTYREGDVPKPLTSRTTVFDDELIVFARVGGPRLPITSTVGICRQLRRSLMAHADEPISEVLSGHRPNGDASQSPHMAIIPLPVVKGPHSDGSIIGLGIVLPRPEHVGPEARAAVFSALARLEEAHRRERDEETPTVRILLGEAGVLELQRVAWGEDRRVTLRPSTWTSASTQWATATPIALDRNPGDLHDSDVARRRLAFESAAASIAEAVDRIGLPRPVEIDALRSCVLPGTAKPRSYPRYPIDNNRPQRVLVHARLVFLEPVRGPILLGAGRYQGLGLCLPLHDDDQTTR